MNKNKLTDKELADKIRYEIFIDKLFKKIRALYNN